jgi:phage terminase small subunit|nr:MAG TPA: Terminase small subunit [Caudoviricetes sp.]
MPKTIRRKRLKPDYLNQKQFEFFENYLATNNITQSAIDAGYSEKTAGQQGCRMLKSIKGQNYIAERMAELDEEKVATANEVLEYLTSVMRGEVQDQFDLEPSLSDRTKAASELARRLVDTKPAVIPVKIVDDIPRTKEA